MEASGWRLSFGPGDRGTARFLGDLGCRGCVPREGHVQMKPYFADALNSGEKSFDFLKAFKHFPMHCNSGGWDSFAFTLEPRGKVRTGG